MAEQVTTILKGSGQSETFSEIYQLRFELAK
jgi:hypothetical protein